MSSTAAAETTLLTGKFSDLTSFFSLIYLAVFLPVCIIGYSLMPKKLKKYFLLVASFCFYFLISGKLLVYLLLAIVVTFLFGLWLDNVGSKRDIILKQTEKSERKAVKKRFLHYSRWILAFAVTLLAGGLLVFKYSAFALSNINVLFRAMDVSFRLKVPSFIMPIGISFFSLMAISYLVDVYRGVIPAEKKPFKLALWLSYFPQIVEGPICRYSQTADALWSVEKIKFDNLTLGLQRILFGLMKKLVVADRLNTLVSAVFENYREYSGGIIALAAICYTIQLYMDFSGSMDAVVGTAQIFGVTMPENFNHPFFSKTISEFWTRWHISLGAWFKDYIFYPLTMSKPLKKLTSNARKKIGNHYGPLLSGSIALLCVWFLNGLWHGSDWNYIFFGMYHFVLILCGSLISPPSKWLCHKLKIKTDSWPYKAMQIVRTIIFVIIGELFFRAEGLNNGLNMFSKMVGSFSFTALTPTLLEKLGVDIADLIIVGVTVVIVLVVSILNERGICIRTSLKKKNVVLRWAIWYALILFIVIFGAYGRGYIPVDPMYANF